MDCKLVGEVRHQVGEVHLRGLQFRPEEEDCGGLLLAKESKSQCENHKIPLDVRPVREDGCQAGCLLCLSVGL